MAETDRWRRVLVVGESGSVASALIGPLSRMGIDAEHLTHPTDLELIAELRHGVDAVAVVTRDDALALRLTLLAAHTAPGVPLLTTLFDKTAAAQLRAAVPQVTVISPWEIVAPELAEACLANGASKRRGLGRRLRLPAIVDGALRLLVLSGLGLLAILLLETLLSSLVLHERLVDAFHSSSGLVATVGFSPQAEHAPGWYKLVSAGCILITLGLVAVFTAALVRRLSRRRLTTLFGPRQAPRSHHVLVVGLGQVGLRLALHLRDLGVPVLAIEKDDDVIGVRLAHAAGLPVVIANGVDVFTLKELGISRARVVAAVTSDDLVNVEIGLSARAAGPDVPLVLRLGDGEVAAETESLLHLGTIIDAHRSAAEALAQSLSTLAERDR
ncbi:MAG TPA: NAD(P)-binding protein [Baekduia sp.]|nr:NAD(P)-binding protein [Baekduia sp.]